MKRILKLIGVLLLLLLVKTGIAQLPTTLPHNLYTQNRILFNPANTGDLGQAFINIRNHWSVAQGPENYTFGAQSKIGKKRNMGLGVVLERDEYGVYQDTKGMLNYSYTATLAENHNLSFGLSGGFVDKRVDTKSIYSDLENAGQANSELDAIINDYKGSRFGAGVGLTYNWKKKLEIGFAMPDLFEQETYDLKQYFVGMISYKFYAIPEKLEIQPSVLFAAYTREDYSVNHADLNLYACLNQTLWVQGTYRTESPAFVIAAGVNLYNIGVGYGYQHQMDELPQTFGGVHEVMLTYYFDKDRKEKLNEELLNNNQLEMLMSDSIAVTEDDYQDQLDSLRKEIETLKLLLQVKDLKDWGDAFQNKLKEYQDKYNQLEEAIGPEVLGKHILFDEDKFEIKSQFYGDLDRIAAEIKAKNAVVTVIGYTNSNGSAEYNMDLSFKRSSVIIEYLVAKGVNRSLLKSEGMGQTQPIADNKTAAGRAMNRRVQFKQTK
jgi:type IX secretion system PorP/SprF family membrane protein